MRGIRKAINRDCAVCRFMRGLAFSSIGGGVGAFLAWIVGASHENMMMSAIVFSAIFAFGLTKRQQNKRQQKR